MVRGFRRLILPAILGLAAYFAVFGGEYSLLDVRRARAARDVQAQRLTALHQELDSLRARVDSLENDATTLERLARERYGMIRDGEVLYRFAEPDSTDTAPEGGR